MFLNHQKNGERVSSVKIQPRQTNMSAWGSQGSVPSSICLAFIPAAICRHLMQDWRWGLNAKSPPCGMTHFRCRPEVMLIHRKRRQHAESSISMVTQGGCGRPLTTDPTPHHTGQNSTGGRGGRNELDTLNEATSNKRAGIFKKDQAG